MDIWKIQTDPGLIADMGFAWQFKRDYGGHKMKKVYKPFKRQFAKGLIAVFGIVLSPLFANAEEAALQYNLWYLIKSPLQVFTVDGLIGAFFVIVMAAISAHFYKHKGAAYIGEKTEKIESPDSFRYVYRYIQITTIVASIGAFLTDLPVFLELHNSLIWNYIGIAISTVAITLFVSAKMTIGEQYSPCFDSYVPTDVIRDGLYKYVRHPIYMSNILLLAGMVVATGSVWIILNVVLLSVYYLNSAVKEEEVLKEKFPVYSEYMKTTGMIIPSPKIFRTHQLR
jgi:protein-S-isoprenylcysteine O-methyltransferase Ste14